MTPPLRRALAAAAGPVAIVVSVLVVLHFFAFSGLISRQNPDLLALWLPEHCFLGTALRSGHIPAWNPYSMGGAPFAADPQSGWMYAPAMLLYTAFSCGTALRWFVVLQPILAGLGIYAFARSEGLSRVAATTGGLALALSVGGSEVVLSLPFSAAIAWTAVLLAAASKLMHAPAWPSRLVWVALTALAWGQLAAAHLSNGLVLGTGALVFYLVTRAVIDARAGARSGPQLLGVLVLLLFALPLVNLAYLLPRLAYLPRTSLGLGYERLQVLSRAFSGGLKPVGQLPGGAIRSTTPLRFVLSPGLYLGATALALTFAGWRSRWRGLAIGFGLFGAACYVLSMDAVAEGLAPHIRHWPLADFYLREPARFAFGIPIAVAVLAAVGVDAWREAASWRERALMVAPAVVVWGVLPFAFHADFSDIRLFLVAAVIAMVVLALAARRPLLIVLVPVALAGELVAGGLAGQVSAAPPEPEGPRDQQILEPLYPLDRPDVRPGEYLAAGPIARTLQREGGGRYISIDPGGWDNRGLHVHQHPRSRGLMAMNQSMVFDIEEAQGYNATEQLPYWEFIRAADPRRIKYNAAYLMNPAQLALDLLDVGWIVAPTDQPPDAPNATPVAHEGQWTLYRIHAPPRAQLFTVWNRVPDGTSARKEVLSSEFRPSEQLVLEGPGPKRISHAGTAPSSARFQWLGPQEATVDVRAPAAGVVLIRNVFDPNWHATVDGDAVPLLRADYLLQGVRVPAERHRIELRYDDATIGYGLLGSVLSLLALFGTALGLWAARRRRASRGSPVAESVGDADGGADPDLVEAP